MGFSQGVNFSARLVLVLTNIPDTLHRLTTLPPFSNSSYNSIFSNLLLALLHLLCIRQNPCVALITNTLNLPQSILHFVQLNRMCHLLIVSQCNKYGKSLYIN